VGEKTESPLSSLEVQFWEHISDSFRLEIVCINKSLELIEKINSYLYEEVSTDIPFDDPVLILEKILKKPIYDPGKPVSQWSNADLFRQFIKDPVHMQQMVWSLLCREAAERLNSARLLILTGHCSRMLSCIRDSNECLCWADFCRKDQKASERWLGHQKVKVPNSFQYTAPLSKDIGDPGVLDKYGTHSYLDAVATSILPMGPFVDSLEYSKSESVMIIHKEHTIGCLGLLLMAIQRQLLYLASIRPDLKDKFPEIEDMAKAIDYIESGLIKEATKLNETFTKHIEGHLS